MYIGDYLGRRTIYSPEALAVVDTGKDPGLRLTYAQMNERANRLANGLAEIADIGKGHRVAILAQDGVEHLDLLFACGKLGAIHTALNWRLHWRELQQILADVTPAVLIYDDMFTEAVTELARAETSIQHWIHLDGPGIPGSRGFNGLLAQSPATPRTCETLGEEDIAAIVFTGGTTGLPRGARISHRQIAWNCLNTVIHDLGRDDVYLNVFPMFHVGGLFVYTLPQVVLGGTTVLLKRFDPERVLELIQEERVTVFAAVPAMYQMLTQTKAWTDIDLRSLRFCTSGGAPLPVPLVKQYTREKGIRFKQGFGMTEFGPGLFALSPEDAIRKVGSIGRPNFYVDARVVDRGNRPLGPGEVGELVLKGPSMASGYFNVNNALDWTRVIDAEGWFHTGDLARYDEEWYFYIVDRLKDMFISGGENIYPAEIEAAMYRHPAVFQCAVVGIPDPKWGEAGKAFVVLKPDHAVTPEELLTHLGEHLARYKIPRHIEFVTALPISAAGKVLRRELRER
ncbi:MAG TPA: long-chain fatty acid--CoA ligase [Candidatus Competibacteraceae bacterium]|nr:long-chain fatty acid--CoA ligase [Candidatus Competibacteraceae bacterium]MCP5134381.1 long-chain fatty acid--CoA ligase [Gammaproteobacteria bacterium]HPF57838.1 long-chain fatty acid--CoA ligase [Candidatus Competibacteraceae bacterium]HRY17408.1 long-chain fatty acid--CoA ligase [Candidatus Competibacteraceae bacterium]